MLVVPFLSSALALTLPVRAVVKQPVDATAEGDLSAVAAGTLTFVDPVTGKAIPGVGKLLPVGAKAHGRGAIGFSKLPTSQSRRFAVYLLDANAKAIGAPEEITLAFDADGAAEYRRVGAGRFSKVRTDPSHVGELMWSRAWTPPGASPYDAPFVLEAEVDQTDLGGAFVGLVDLEADGAGLARAYDLTILTAAQLQAVEALGLHAVIPITKHGIEVEGTVTFDVVVAADAPDPSFGLSLLGADGSVVAERGYVSALPKVKKNGAYATLTLKKGDEEPEPPVFGFDFTVAGDRRGATVKGVWERYEEFELVDEASIGAPAVSALLLSASASGDVADDKPLSSHELGLTLSATKTGVVSSHLCWLRHVGDEGEEQLWDASCTRDGGGGEVAGLTLRRDVLHNHKVRGDGDLRVAGSGAGTPGVGYTLVATLDPRADGKPLFTAPMTVDGTTWALGLPWITSAEDGDDADFELVADVNTPGVTWDVAEGVASAWVGDEQVDTLTGGDVDLEATGDATSKGRPLQFEFDPSSSGTETLQMVSEAFQVTTNPAGRLIVRR